MKTWAESWGDADQTCGADLPPVRALPHMSSRAAEFAARAATPDGRPAQVKPSVFARIRAALTRTNDDELAALRRLMDEVSE